MSEYPQLGKWFPPRGQCGFCGHPDARHRLWDSLMCSLDTAKQCASNFSLPIAAVQAVWRIEPYQTKKGG